MKARSPRLAGKISNSAGALSLAAITTRLAFLAADLASAPRFGHAETPFLRGSKLAIEGGFVQFVGKVGGGSD